MADPPLDVTLTELGEDVGVTVIRDPGTPWLPSVVVEGAADGKEVGEGVGAGVGFDEVGEAGETTMIGVGAGVVFGVTAPEPSGVGRGLGACSEVSRWLQF